MVTPKPCATGMSSHGLRRPALFGTLSSRHIDLEVHFLTRADNLALVIRLDGDWKLAKAWLMQELSQ